MTYKDKASYDSTPPCTVCIVQNESRALVVLIYMAPICHGTGTHTYMAPTCHDTGTHISMYVVTIYMALTSLRVSE